MARRIESLMIDGPVGKLEALLEEPEDREPREAFLVCHPHPQGGGTMHNKVVYRIARALRRSGAAVLRFNYRGVNRSEGQYDEGAGETEDARVCLAYLRERYPDLPYSLAGFSFGSRIILRIGCELAAARRLVAVGVAAGRPEMIVPCNLLIQKYFIQSTHDQYGPVAEMQAYFDSVGEPKKLIWVEAQDHFFAGALEEFEQAVLQVGGEFSSR